MSFVFEDTRVSSTCSALSNAEKLWAHPIAVVLVLNVIEWLQHDTPNNAETFEMPDARYVGSDTCLLTLHLKPLFSLNMLLDANSKGYAQKKLLWRATVSWKNSIPNDCDEKPPEHQPVLKLE